MHLPCVYDQDCVHEDWRGIYWTLNRGLGASLPSATINDLDNWQSCCRFISVTGEYFTEAFVPFNQMPLVWTWMFDCIICAFIWCGLCMWVFNFDFICFKGDESRWLLLTISTSSLNRENILLIKSPHQPEDSCSLLTLSRPGWISK